MLQPATVYALGLVIIAAVYIGFSVADGRWKVIAAEVAVATVFGIVAAAAVTGSAWLLVVGLTGHGLKHFWQHRTQFVTGTRWWPPFAHRGLRRLRGPRMAFAEAFRAEAARVPRGRAQLLNRYGALMAAIRLAPFDEWHHFAVLVTIGAPVEEVWKVLTDLASYPQWNPLIIAAAGPLAVGKRLKLTIKPPGGRAMVFRPCVTTLEPYRYIEWLGHLALCRASSTLGTASS